MKQYCINNKIYNCELLTENMATGELWYFLRNADDSSDVIKWRQSEMPDEYMPNWVTFKKGCLVKDGKSSYILAHDKEFDVSRTPVMYVLDSDGEPISEGETYVTTDGYVFFVGHSGMTLQITKYFENWAGSTRVAKESVSFVTGKPITDLVYFYLGGTPLPANRNECVVSTVSGDYYPACETQDYLEDEDDLILRSDVIHGLVKDYVICDRCDEITHIHNMTETDDEDVCDSCLNEYYTWSDVEQCYIDNDDVCLVGDEPMSYGYRDEHYHQCEECGGWFDIDEEGVESIDGYYLCDDCYLDFEDDEGDIYYRDCGYIQGYHPDIEFNFYGNGSKYLGCEWEVQGGGENSAKAKSIFGSTREFYCCHDGSLDEGFEAITHPCTPEYMLNNIPWKDLTCRLDEKGYYDEDGAGFHIHISRSHFVSNSNVGKLVRFFSLNYMKLVEFANRTLGKARHWADATDCQGHTKFLDSYEEARGQRYSAINVQNSETIEIRLFNTSYDHVVIKAYIQFADVISDLANGKFSDMTFENVKKVAEERNYTELVNYMSEKGLV